MDSTTDLELRTGDLVAVITFKDGHINGALVGTVVDSDSQHATIETTAFNRLTGHFAEGPYYSRVTRRLLVPRGDIQLLARAESRRRSNL